MKTILNLMLTIALVTSAIAQDAGQKGLEIATNADLADQGYQNSEVEITMILRNKQGQQIDRELTSSTYEVQEDGDQSLITFKTPADVKGTAVLTYSHKIGPDDQWLYLPAIKRVKRISSDNKSGPFMGSEFAYEDIGSQEIEKYTYKFLKEDQLNGTPVVVVERYPVDPKSGYQRQVVWWNKENYRPEKIEYYDRKNSLLKTLTYNGYRQYLGKFWRADRLEMINHQSGKSTVLEFRNYKFQTGLTANDFSQNALIRAGRN